MAALEPLEKQWGGTLAERNARQLAAYKAASRRRMITSAILPTPLARLPWRLIFMVAGICGFGLVVLYSAAGGRFRALGQQAGDGHPVLPVGRDRHVDDQGIDHEGADLPGLRR